MSGGDKNGWESSLSRETVMDAVVAQMKKDAFAKKLREKFDKLEMRMVNGTRTPKGKGYHPIRRDV